MRNLGDDVFFQVIIQWLSEKCNVRKVYVTARKGRVPKVVDKAQVIPINPDKPLIGRMKFLRVFFYALRSDILCFGGGSIFKFGPFALLTCLLALLRLLRGNRLKIIALGVSVGPLSSRWATKWCRRFFSYMDFVLLRDSASEQLMTELSFKTPRMVSYDLALTWDKAWAMPSPDGSDKQNFIGLSINDYDWLFTEGGSDIDKARSCVIADAVLAVAKRHPELNIRIFEVCTDEKFGDAGVTKRFLQQFAELKDRVMVCAYDGESPEHLIRKLTSCDCIIASRMHAGIFGIIAGVPVYQISYASKIRDFFDRCGLSKKFLIDKENLCYDDIELFLEQAISKKLCEFSKTQRDILIKHRDNSRDILEIIEKWIRSECTKRDVISDCCP